MAWVELRIILAKIVFLYDFEMVNEKLDWERESKCTLLWHKPDLLVRVKPAKRG